MKSTRSLSPRVFTLLTALSLSVRAVPEGPPRPDSEAVPNGLASSEWTTLRAAIEAGRHSFRPVAGGWQAQNPGQQWITTFDRRGFVAQPQGGGWTWGLELLSYGFGTNQYTLGGTPAVKADGPRLSYQWNVAVQEWFLNDPRGLEHGFTVNQRPEHGEPSDLSLTLATRGTLRPVVTADRLGVLFQNPDGATELNYTGLKAWDADGKTLPSHFEAVGKTDVRLLVNERGARYPITIDPLAQQAYLKPASVGISQREDRFGSSVAVSGDTVVVGAPFEGSGTLGVNSTPDESASLSGAAYVFVRRAGGWTQEAYLKPAAVGTSQAFDTLGRSVAISGDTVVVGAPNEASSTTGVNSVPDEKAGTAGAAYVFTRRAGLWTQQAYLKPAAVGTSQERDLFGSSVSVSGDTVVVGAPGEASSTTGIDSMPNEKANASGAAYVFTRSAEAWTQQAYLKPAAVGTSQLNDAFGISVAVSGDSLIVGAYWENSSTMGVNSQPNESAAFAGAAYIFARNAGVWAQQAYLKPADVGTSQAGDRFGNAVAILGDTAVVGAPFESSSSLGVNSTPNESASRAGAAYIFGRRAGEWTQEAYLKPAAVGSTQANDNFGISVAISGDTVVVGANGEDGSTTGVDSTPNEVFFSNSGAAYTFVRGGAGWKQQAYLKPAAVGTSQADDGFGISVAISGDTVVVGALQEASSSLGVNSTPNENAKNAGAAYVFSGFGSVVESPFVITSIVDTGVAIRISFPTVTGRIYTLLQSPTADLGTWVIAPGQSEVSGNNAEQDFLVPGPVETVPTRFYRVEYEP